MTTLTATTETINSREVAEMVEKRHNNLVADIRKYIAYMLEEQNSKVSNGLNACVEDYFIESSYQSEDGGRTYACYEVTKKGCELIAHKMTGKKGTVFTARYIERFHSMKQALETSTTIPNTVDSNFMFQIAEAMKKQEETIAAQNSLIEKQKPKVALAESIEKADTLIKVGDMAKILCQAGVKIGQNRFFEWLRENGYIMNTNSSKTNKVPTQRAIELGVLQLVESTFVMDGETQIYKTSMVTPKGQVYFMKKFMQLVENLKPAELEVEEIKVIEKISKPKTKQEKILSLLN